MKSEWWSMISFIMVGNEGSWKTPSIMNQKWTFIIHELLLNYIFKIIFIINYKKLNTCLLTYLEVGY
jgi:hypothetical protein